MTDIIAARTSAQLLSDRPRSLLASLPIGLFDSGVGGLTVLAALRRRLPEESFIYLGDTARVPYGTKGKETVERYALQAAEQLIKRDIKLLVIACNTATAAALPVLQKAYAPLPVIGVVEPGAEAACKASKAGRILVLATESTIRSNAYSLAITALRPEAKVLGLACSLFVPLAEEGWVEGAIVEDVAARYLMPVLNKGAGMGSSAAPAGTDPDCIVLGCTHFPLFASAIKNVVSSLVRSKIAFVDSAATTAEAVQANLSRQGLLAAGTGQSGAGSVHFLCTDAPERFARVGSIFLGEAINYDNLELVVL